MRHSVRMIETTFASEDGLNPKYYLKGRTYNVSDYLLETFIKMGVVYLDDQQDQCDFYENKVIVPEKRKPGRPKK